MSWALGYTLTYRLVGGSARLATLRSAHDSFAQGTPGRWLPAAVALVPAGHGQHAA